MMILRFNRACDAAPSWTMPLREIITGQEVKRPTVSDDIAFYALVGGEKTITCSQLLSGKLDNAIDWYPKWLETQFEAIPPWITDCVQSLPEIFKEVALQTAPGTSIDDLASHLLRWDLVKSGKDQDERLIARSIAFAILGWQTMLFQPALGTCPLQLMALADVMDGYTGQAFMKFKQDHSTVKRPLSDFLLGFGLMLPKENICVSEDTEDLQAYEKIDIVRPEEINVSLLHRFARIDVEWVDVMAPHLEFDKATNKLYIFRHPSFCMANLSLLEESGMRSMIYNCATQDDDNSQWASEVEISQFLHEILLSYRLLFGQDKESRRGFKEMINSADDIILQQLCSNKDHQFPELFKERDFYRLKRDFPILRSRLATLSHQMSNMKPRDWKQLWKDKRDSASWLTFWAVIVIGGAGLLLALIQVLLQAVQLAHP